MNIAFLVLAAYGAIIFIGGFIGYMKANSSVSLFSGLIMSIFFELSALGAKRGVEGSLYLSALGAFLTMLFFGYRFHATRVWMPGGVMTILSAAVLIFLIALIRGYIKK
jgi:uncharacterized membrane protein (UPF0136 family)